MEAYHLRDPNRVIKITRSVGRHYRGVTFSNYKTNEISLPVVRCD